MCTISRVCIASLALTLILCGQLFAVSSPAPPDSRCPDFWVFPMGGFDWPTWARHGSQLDAPISFSNGGDSDIVFTLTTVEEIGPAGWLALPPELQGTIVLPPHSDIFASTIRMNVGGIVNAPGTVVYLKGYLVIDHGSPLEDPYILDIECWVADTLYLPSFDTVSTGCVSLVVNNSGNFGNQGDGEVNLDFFNFGDCDNAEPGSGGDTIPGRADVYLYDASPVICWTDEFDTVRCNWSIFGHSPTTNSNTGFYPMGPSGASEYYVYDTCDGANDSTYICDTYSSQFVTRDTGILIEKTWYIPHVPDHQENDGASFIVQMLRVSSADGETHTGLNIGEIIDWDIPSDSASRNVSGFDATNKLIYQQGSEYNDDPEECQENSDRYGGIELLAIREDDGGIVTEHTNDPYGAWTSSNALWVYPTGGFVPEKLDSLMTVREGYVTSDSTDADLNSVMTFKSNYTLTPTKTIQIYSCLITSRAGYSEFIAAAADCHTWYADYLAAEYTYCGCCVGSRGDVNMSGALDISDLVYLVDYMFTGGPPPPCFEEADVNGSGAVDISDLVYLVDYMFTGGPPPPPCH